MKRRMVFSDTTSTFAASERLMYLGSRGDPTYGAHTDIGGMTRRSAECEADLRLCKTARDTPRLIYCRRHDGR